MVEGTLHAEGNNGEPAEMAANDGAAMEEASLLWYMQTGAS